ncbi:cytochrome P450 4C1 isoform X2 [Nasonia vitripennis]|nr:cytochrome P450 4C1 isoform X2 [Nasonia vitripennis]XP_008202893.1 cytochrome P450 4C1 isoform X2 [Nasonia vitripennis]XP_032458147.1 cytochrome P450 4C1 isoform X2 [Nasonia vitripennis]XP_032458148.1 cytochrome P450 4C1 isoform X2 [Nasonia vitripennis]XP_032458149.1 cytochrome P450 4C1 isoform X2 [Nasonia vitripennis]
MVAKIPGPYPLPFLGNLLSFAGNREELWNKLRALMKGCSIKRMWFPTRAWIFIQDADDMEVLLTSKVNVNKGQAYNLALKWLHTGLLTSKREKWTERRKIVNTGFHYNVMKKYVEISIEYTKQFVEEIKSHGDECVLNILPLLSDLTLQIICESALGISLDKLDNKVLQEYKEAIREIDDIFVYRGARPYITDWMMYFLPLGRRQDHAIKILHEFTDRIIRERKEYHANFQENRSYQHFVDDVEESAEDDSFKGTKKRLVMLDVLLSAEQDGLIDEKGIREEVDLLVLAGHDTTSISMVIMLMLLAENPEAQDRARAEVIQVFSENGGKLDIKEIQKFEYLDRCIKEAMRLYPAIGNFIRHLNEDVQLKKYLLPAGVDVAFFVYDLHRDPKHWQEPEKFDPDRFLEENVKKRHPFAYMPFSAGPRNCIGQKFAMFEMKVILSHVLYNFYLEPVDLTASIRFEVNVILRLSHPVHVKFIRRDV